MSSRTYLSIGDVLTLLREEFPDVTISKIRFLESQGLVNPERSPSGYRKFFEADVERLRWVLRQQREHFLPLKVIRDRLADGDLSEGAAGEPLEGEPLDGESLEGESSAAALRNGKVPARAHAVAGAGLSGRARSGSGGLGGTTTAARTEARTEEHSTQADDEAMARILADASRRAARVPESSRRHAPLSAVPDPGAPHAAGPTDVQNVPREHDAAATAAVVSAAVAEGLRVDPDAPHSAGIAGTLGGVPVHSHVAGDVAREQEASLAASPLAPTAAGPAASAPAAVPTSPRHASGGSGSSGRAGVGAGVSATTSDAPAAPAPGAPGGSPGRGSGRQTGGADAGRTAAGRTAAGGAAAGGTAAGGTDAGGTGGSVKRTSGGDAAGYAGTLGRASTAGMAGNRGGATGTQPVPAGGIVTGASLTSDELCAASGLSEAELAGLQGFGLIEPIMVAGIPTFDEDALTVANLAAEFRKYGIEARHLRPYRNAVDREVGLIEQVIIPLLRQRNPESRQRAVEAAEDLGALGQTMRATLLRTALRRHVGG